MNTAEYIQKFNKIFEKYNLDNDEIKQYLLMKRYERISNSYREFITLFKKEADPRTAKYWKVFKDLFEMYHGRPVDMDLFFQAQFEEKFGDGKFLPQFLKADASWTRYRKFLKRYNPNKKDERFLSEQKFKAKQLYLTKKFITDWLKLHEYDENNYAAFFEYKEDFQSPLPTTFIYVQTNKVSKLFCAISKSFGRMCKELDSDCVAEYFTDYELAEYRKGILIYPKVVEYAKEKFGANEIDWSWEI